MVEARKRKGEGKEKGGGEEGLLTFSPRSFPSYLFSYIKAIQFFK
jgi:hypothetical protein